MSGVRVNILATNDSRQYVTYKENEDDFYLERSEVPEIMTWYHCAYMIIFENNIIAFLHYYIASMLDFVSLFHITDGGVELLKMET